MAKAAADYGATVLLANHTEFDNAFFKAHTAANRKRGEANPFDVGRDGVSRYFTRSPGLRRGSQDSSKPANSHVTAGGAPLTTTTIVVRYTDERGLPVDGPPIDPSSQVLQIEAVGDIPGTYALDVKLGRTAKTADRFDILAGVTATQLTSRYTESTV